MQCTFMVWSGMQFQLRPEYCGVVELSAHALMAMLTDLSRSAILSTEGRTVTLAACTSV